MSGFYELGINEGLCQKLAALGISEPTAVQKKVIPEIAAQKNVVFQSATGSGKTFAFLLPLLQKIEGEPNPTKAGKVFCILVFIFETIFVCYAVYAVNNFYTNVLPQKEVAQSNTVMLSQRIPV